MKTQKFKPVETVTMTARHHVRLCKSDLLALLRQADFDVPEFASVYVGDVTEIDKDCPLNIEWTITT